MFDCVAFFRVFLLMLIFLLACIGASQWQFGNYEGYRFYYTGLQLGGGERSGYGSLCGSIRTAMRAGLAFAIIGCIFIAFSLIAAALAALSTMSRRLVEYGSPLRVISLVLSTIAFFALTICWPVTNSARTGNHCGVTLSHQGFGIARGMSLIIAAWCLLFFDAICAIVSIVILTTMDH